ncbi:1545_t:CDS:2, partial [Dentiscutata heterogama]
ICQDSTKEIRIALNTPHRRLGCNYNPQTDFVYEHGPTSRNATKFISFGHARGMYRINVWRSIYIVFSDTPYTYIVGSVKNIVSLAFACDLFFFLGCRGEKAGLASSERKNCYRTLLNTELIQRKAIGKKGDAYIRTIGSISMDWAVSEAGHKCEDAVLIRTNFDCLAGYTCRYTKGDPLKVYTDANNFNKSLDVLIEIIYGKLLILKTIEVINSGMDSQNKIAR